jgi:ribonucleoside-diphosphate reductase alpha chain
MNLSLYDEWKDTDAVETLTYFLDAVMQEFITKLESLRDSDDQEDKTAVHFMQRAYTFAVENRALGLGALGWHTLLQSKKIAFESEEAMKLNTEIFSTMKERSYAASTAMAAEY